MKCKRYNCSFVSILISVGVMLAVGHQSQAQSFDMISPDSLTDESVTATFFKRNDFKSECGVCRNSNAWGLDSGGCNPECAADILSATFGCNLESSRRQVRFSLEPLRPQDGLRLVSEAVQASKMVLESGGKTKAATITDISYALRDYDGLWTFSLAGSWGDTKLNDLIKMAHQEIEWMNLMGNVA